MKVDNFQVLRKSGLTWLIIESATVKKSSFLKQVLSSRFPHFLFIPKRFTPEDLKTRLLPDGVVAELKTLSQPSLRFFDRFYKTYKNVPLILIVTPLVYGMLLKRRRTLLDQTIIIVSEFKSLDYIAQLPRLIEEAGRKRILKFQNERLRRLLDQKIPAGKEELSSISESAFPCGLKITFHSWRRFGKRIGSLASQEVSRQISHTIEALVRNSDRVLHSQENEILVLLNHTDSSRLMRCRERIEDALKSMLIEANRRRIQLPFRIRTFESNQSV